jgi:prophage regulatory protein
MKMLTMKEVCRRLGVTRATVYRWVSGGWFPSPKKLSNYRTGRIAWPETTIEAWLAARPEKALRQPLPE